jgi:hypothetical protein
MTFILEAEIMQQVLLNMVIHCGKYNATLLIEVIEEGQLQQQILLIHSIHLQATQYLDYFTS